MRRYTTIKSNLYAPVSTNIFAQNMIHDHMVSHYRKTYFARSQVDSSPPWKYKSRELYSERPRKKVPKFKPLADRKEETDTSSDVKGNSVSICAHHFNVKRSSDHKKESIAQNQRVVGDSARKDAWSSKKIAQSDSLPCDDVIGVPPLCISSKKQRQNQQHRNVSLQTKTKKCACQDKRKVIYGKSKTATSDNIKENLPKPPGKSRNQHPLHAHFENYHDNGVCISSGSEGNAGDDEDGTPTSSCDDFNQSARNSPLSICNMGIAGTRVCACKHKFLLDKGKHSPCLCHIPIKGAKTAGSMASSRDSAYEGGGIMSSAENQRNSPEDFKGRSKWYQPCIIANYVEKEGTDLKSSEEPTQFCSKSELYMKFLQDVTDDILLQAVYSNEAIKSIFQKHIQKNIYNLDEEYMKLMINKLMEDLGVKPETCCETEQESDILDENHLKSRKNCDCEEAVLESSKVIPFTIGSTQVIKNKETSPRTKNEVHINRKKSIPSLVNIEKNVFMSKEEVMAYLTEMGFEDVLSEEIFQILAKQHSSA